ncbi:isocitrate lyase/phosphoenolpyruvate mutase family protein [Halobaculum sp. WSA2]|uniref:Isocitrate lyase/phosphoenolpyruvate mutase family protein n=1 Tax=Halobaculum saliterrae TaxID=2073113 RepID=A0A6B0T7V7_9EURY|nr:isocitrate lyase/phosphoenolpyruvate mutase family protein [Halobaculum saliterrae]MXR42589.1 isocitrate lyase/phosphoenolpyruvate mutase family protein [Halobaculum saliterrae]
MNHEIQRERAEALRALHHADGPLVLPNAWDAASAILFADAGFDAIGTTSAGIAASRGVPDGEVLSRSGMLTVVEQIADAVALPVTADIEAGYGDTPGAVFDTVAAAIDAGAVGVNLEDGTGDPDDPLAPVDDHVAAIRAARDAAEDAGVPVVVNGRTDVFWLGVGDEGDRLDRAVDRANAYADAGSDCLFVPGVSDIETIRGLVDRLDAPLNVLGGPGAPPVDALASAGVARVSVGSGPMRATLGLLGEVAAELREEGTYESMAGGIPYDDLEALLETAARQRS